MRAKVPAGTAVLSMCMAKERSSKILLSPDTMPCINSQGHVYRLPGVPTTQAREIQLITFI